MVQRLVHQQNRVVHHDADQNDETKHGQHIERLQGSQIEQREPASAASRGDRHGKHDDQWIDKALEQDGHDQEYDDDGKHHIDGHRVTGFHQLVSRSRNTELDIVREPFFFQRIDNLFA